MRALFATLAMVFTVGALSAQSGEVMVVGADTLEYRYTPMDQTAYAQTGVERFGLRLKNYMTLSVDDARRVKFAVVGAPAYSANTGWRLSAQATMLYRAGRNEETQQLSLRGMASLNGCYGVSIDGVNYFDNARHTLAYGGGIGVDRVYLYTKDDATKMGLQRDLLKTKNYNAYIRYNYRIIKGLTLGAVADYAHCTEVVSGELFSGLGVGANVAYSTKKVYDVNLVRGVSMRAEYVAHPAFANNRGEMLHSANITVDYYQPLWRGGLLALDLYGEHHSANTPWMMGVQLGGDSRMRGYYCGRFAGSSLVTLQAELRQRVWEGLVVAGWGGCGALFDESESVVLPTYGAGIRWYFNPTSLVRIDYGRGRNCGAFIVGYTEAF